MEKERIVGGGEPRFDRVLCRCGDIVQGTGNVSGVGGCRIADAHQGVEEVDAQQYDDQWQQGGAYPSEEEVGPFGGGCPARRVR